MICVLCSGFSHPILAANPADAAADAFTLTPRIVNGSVTAAFPSTGALLIYTDASRSLLDTFCSGTLIGCHTFLTAAHCLCSDQSDDAATCARDGVSDPATLEVFLQQGGVVPVESIVIDPAYSFGEAGDLAIIKLGAAVTGVAPVPLNTTRRASLGTRATIVGFGTTGGSPFSASNAGIKRVGQVTTAPCASDISSDTHVCWNFAGTDASSCEGDSGGPLFLDFGAGLLLGGVTSGGANPTCLAPDRSFDTDVFVAAAWIAAEAGSDLGGVACGNLAPSGTGATSVFASNGQVSSTNPQARLQFDVPRGTSLLRVTLNSQLSSGQGPNSTDNNFDLFVQAGIPPSTTQSDCSDTGPIGFGACELSSPRPGTWHVLVNGVHGDGAFQVTATTFARAATAICVGDCRGGRRVTADDLLESVDIALGDMDGATCPAPGLPGGEAMTVADLLTAVNNAASGCPH